MSSSRTNKIIFVTVGTTLFESLIRSTTTDLALEWMCENGYTHLIVQYGKGTKPSIPAKYDTRISVELYSFKPSLQSDMIAADTIISHAGAGTVMEALRMKKERLIVVINTILMDNHQTELADAMGIRRHLFVIHSPEELQNNINKWNEIENFQAKLYSGGDENDFPRILNNFFDFDSKQE
jgi:beta-1,4-N-acetylglucosaminyltransferase